MGDLTLTLNSRQAAAALGVDFNEIFEIMESCKQKSITEMKKVPQKLRN